MVKPDAMMAAAGHVSREYGYTGYVIGCEAQYAIGGGIFLVRHFDGSEFRLLVDRYENVDRLPDEWPAMGGQARADAIAELVQARNDRMAAYVHPSKGGTIVARDNV